MKRQAKNLTLKLQLKGKNAMRVLFIGNSHTYFNSMPHLFAEMCRKNGVDMEVTMITHGGKGWDFHLPEPEVRFNIRYGHYDAVVLQHSAHPMGDLTVMHDCGKQLIEWVKEAGARPILYMTWTTKADGPEVQPVMSNAYLDLAKEMNCEVAPVGEVWWRFHELSPETELYYEDGQHASLQGSTLAAYVIASVFMGKMPENPTEDARMNENLAAACQ